MNACKQELCPNWSGDGNVCPCAIFDLDTPDDPYGSLAWADDLDDGADLDPCNHCPHDNTDHRGDGCLHCGCAVPQ
jgi:hypothetical protein